MEQWLHRQASGRPPRLVRMTLRALVQLERDCSCCSRRIRTWVFIVVSDSGRAKRFRFSQSLTDRFDCRVDICRLDSVMGDGAHISSAGSQHEDALVGENLDKAVRSSIDGVEREEDDVRLDGACIKLYAGNIREPLGQLPSVGMVFGHAIDHGVEGNLAGGCQYTDLAHGPTHE